jgi:hypothetical protein
MIDNSFVLLDLVSQAVAVQQLLKGLTPEEKLRWLERHGTVSLVSELPGFPKTYLFESRTGIQSGFFIDEDDFVFLGDHTTFTVK